ncbi:hypothetical protein ES319_D05G099900v1 [Gossypium barbadense]|uniref:NOT2/NOT3/NOT5 C-terminal domain-containing protein n=2 Tax=Gossypium TaxID=3633 RepID=A0A5J5RAH0_GOSBA|nr:hypothetical protein ES319_D05G099900v1 [Gossypium barbadense]TYG67809.1 hypothetical protein ES288_D05G105300v1 [Gossypium darwinii]
MSGLLNSSINGSASNLPDSSGRSFGTSFSSQSGAASPVFHHTGTIQGLHNIHGSFNIPNMPGTLTSRNSTLSNVPTGGVQQPTGSLSGGRFASNNLPIALSQLSHGGSHGHSGVTNRGGLGVSPILGNAGPRITSSMGNIVGGGNIGRSMSSGGGLSVPGLASRLNLSANSGSGSLSLQGQNRLMSSMLPQGSPQLTSRPNSSGGPQGQLGSLRKQGLTPIVQQNQEFSIQNEDFPALPGFKGGNADYAMDLHQKEQLHDNTISMMQSQQFSMGRSGAFNLGGSYSSHRPQQQQHAPSASSSGVSFASNSGPPGIGLRPLNSSNTVSGMGYDQLIQQYQQHQNQSPFRLQQMSAVNQSFREPGLKSTQAAQSDSDPFGLLGLQSVIKMTNPDLTSLALGIDLTTLGLNLNSSENLHKTFGSPWSDEPAKGDPEFTVPQCYYAKQPPALHQGYFSKFTVDALFYIFYSMPKDEAQLYAANELYNRGWFYHKEFRFWFMRVPNVEPLVKTNTYERGSYHYFDPNSFEIIRKDNFVVHYELLEKRPSLPQH